jgi:mannitol-specific phosphotransferase system IIBC component
MDDEALVVNVLDEDASRNADGGTGLADPGGAAVSGRAAVSGGATATGALDDADTDPAAIPPKPRLVWLRRIGVAMVVLLVAGLIALQVQASRVTDQTEQAEAAQRNAELDQEAAQIRLDSVDARVRVAEEDEAAAAAELEHSRADMTRKGFEEEALAGIQVEKAAQVKDLRSQVKAVAADIAEQNRLAPAADACVFDRLRALNDLGHNTLSEACKTVAGHSPGAG